VVAVMTDVIQNENKYRRNYSRDYIYTVVVFDAAVVVDKECIDVEKANSMLLLLPFVLSRMIKEGRCNRQSSMSM
jgi:hypothetical protein